MSGWLGARTPKPAPNDDDDVKTNDVHNKYDDGYYEFKYNGEIVNAADITRMDKERQVIIGKWQQSGIRGHASLFANYFSLTSKQVLVVRTWAFELFQLHSKNKGQKIILSINGPFLKTNIGDDDNQEYELAEANDQRINKYKCCEFYVVWMSMNDLIKIAKNVIDDMPEDYKLFSNNCRTFVNKMLEAVSSQCEKCKLNSDQMTEYVNKYNSDDPTVGAKVNDVKALDLENSEGKTISIAQVLKRFPIGNQQQKSEQKVKRKKKNDGDCIVM